MKVKTAHLFFEQSGTFKNEFIKLRIPAYDYDIQNNFGETDYVIDLFEEIEKAYVGGKSIFDNITSEDLIMAFFPCIYFCGSFNPLLFSWNFNGYSNYKPEEKTEKIIERSRLRQLFYELLLKFVAVVIRKQIKLIIENPYSPQGYLINNFVKKPDIIDFNRMERGDYFMKPTMFYFFNCEPGFLFTHQNDKIQKKIEETKSSNKAGLCSEARSMISQDYARNFICDFILNKPQKINLQKTIFEIN